ncbi:MAG: Fe-S cluster assembly protein SufD, partial [Mesorhizobium sp.]|nr:Fe-S cluster assembly protein SufD [Mesorhizobium sp.]
MNMRAAPQRTQAETALVAAFGERVSDLPGDAAIALKRDDAIELIKTGLPTRHIEAWHYTDLRRLLTAVPDFDPALHAKTQGPLIDGSVVLPVLNGVAGVGARIDGATVTRLADMLIDGSFGPALGARDAADTIGAVNTAFVADGYFVDI